MTTSTEEPKVKDACKKKPLVMILMITIVGALVCMFATAAAARFFKKQRALVQQQSRHNKRRGKPPAKWGYQSLLGIVILSSIPVENILRTAQLWAEYKLSDATSDIIYYLVGIPEILIFGSLFLLQVSRLQTAFSTSVMSVPRKRIKQFYCGAIAMCVLVSVWGYINSEPGSKSGVMALVLITLSAVIFVIGICLISALTREFNKRLILLVAKQFSHRSPRMASTPTPLPTTGQSTPRMGAVAPSSVETVPSTSGSAASSAPDFALDADALDDSPEPVTVSHPRRFSAGDRDSIVGPVPRTVFAGVDADKRTSALAKHIHSVEMVADESEVEEEHHAEEDADVVEEPTEMIQKMETKSMFTLTSSSKQKQQDKEDLKKKTKGRRSQTYDGVTPKPMQMKESSVAFGFTDHVRTFRSGTLSDFDTTERQFLNVVSKQSVLATSIFVVNVISVSSLLLASRSGCFSIGNVISQTLFSIGLGFLCVCVYLLFGFAEQEYQLVCAHSDKVFRQFAMYFAKRKAMKQ